MPEETWDEACYRREREALEHFGLARGNHFCNYCESIWSCPLESHPRCGSLIIHNGCWRCEPPDDVDDEDYEDSNPFDNDVSRVLEKTKIEAEGE